MSHLLLSLPSKPDYANTSSNCLKWMIEQLYRSREPMGLKHRQCTLLQAVLEREKLPLEVVQGHFKSHAPLDRSQVIGDYAEILQDEYVASRSLEEYFQRMKIFETEYR